MVPRFYQVTSRREETRDTVTLELTAPSDPLGAFAPGQFAMLTVFGVGEAPISVSGLGGAADDDHRHRRPHHADADGLALRLTHTVRGVGAVTRALQAAELGQSIGVRGPFGTGWDVPSAAGHDVVVIAGGIGLAPLRPVVLAALAERRAYGRVVLLFGARSPSDLLYTGELESWRSRGVEVAVTVDRPEPGWRGHVGLVTSLIGPARLTADRAAVFLCGPEVMMKHTADALVASGVPPHRIRMSLERTMHCGAGWCGHCQLGPVLLCRDGPVAGYDEVCDLLRIREL
ncbi:FAD/NAD(P)-binding protein [Catenulispora subtropica]|uniref:FAD/NAD(P)-binding protein n=1 Tax=Catenulispora subtropica TaxID=450798 RepID=A0ABN2RLN3_9ACTN